MIFISHRLANLKNAQTIHVLKDGRLAESGSHAELENRRGEYAGLWSRQQEVEAFASFEEEEIQ